MRQKAQIGQRWYRRSSKSPGQKQRLCSLAHGQAWDWLFTQLHIPARRLRAATYLPTSLPWRKLTAPLHRHGTKQRGDGAEKTRRRDLPLAGKFVALLSCNRTQAPQRTEPTARANEKGQKYRRTYRVKSRLLLVSCPAILLSIAAHALRAHTTPKPQPTAARANERCKTIKQTNGLPPSGTCAFRCNAERRRNLQSHSNIEKQAISRTRKQPMCR